MKYDEIVTLCEQLDYRDKFRLAQLLIQYARKEEENSHPEKRLSDKKGNSSKKKSDPANDVGSIEYVSKRILSLKPTKKKSLKNSIRAMFQFQGGITETDEKRFIAELQKLNYIKIDSNNRVTYP